MIRRLYSWITLTRARRKLKQLGINPNDYPNLFGAENQGQIARLQKRKALYQASGDLVRVNLVDDMIFETEYGWDALVDKLNNK